MTARRFDTEHDTPCPFRLARFGYRLIGEFRAPKVGEFYIAPSAGPTLAENEPEILEAKPEYPGERPAVHIVEALPEGGDGEDNLLDLLDVIVLAAAEFDNEEETN